jgi:kinesin family protein 22
MFSHDHLARIIEIEWAVKNDKEYVPSPKPEKTKKVKGRGLRKSLRVLRLRESPEVATAVLSAPEGGCVDADEWLDVEESKENEESGPGVGPNKRTADWEVNGDTPLKKLRRGSEASEQDGWIPPAPTKRGKRKLGLRN